MLKNKNKNTKTNKNLDKNHKEWYTYSTSLGFCAEREARLFAKINGGADMRVKITLACSECKQRNYDTVKNKKNDPDRLEMNKYCKFCRKHTLHKETK